MSTIICCIALCNAWCPCPGNDAAAKFLPYLSSCCPLCPKYLPTIGAMTGHGWPRYLANPIRSVSFSMYPTWSGGECRKTHPIAVQICLPLVWQCLFIVCNPALRHLIKHLWCRLIVTKSPLWVTRSCGNIMSGVPGGANGMFIVASLTPYHLFWSHIALSPNTNR